MKNLRLVATLLFCLVGMSPIYAETAIDLQTVTDLESQGEGCFVPNQGQWADSIRFGAQIGGCNWWFTQSAVYADLQVADPDSSSTREQGDLRRDEPGRLRPVGNTQQDQRLLLATHFSDARGGVVPQGQDQTAGKFNFFCGARSERWAKSLPVYRRVVYSEIYPGIDLHFYVHEGKLEYDLIVDTGADLNTVRFKVDAVDQLTLSDSGALELEIGDLTLTQLPPHIFQFEAGRRRDCLGGYVLLGEDSYSFALCGDYEPSRPVVIDPVLSYSSYLGGSGADHGRAIAVDDFGDVYILGETESFDFPTERGAFDTNHGGRDLFVTKFRAGGQVMVYSTYLGGSGDEEAGGLAVDAAGRAYVAATTTSTDLAVTAAVQPEPAGDVDCMLVALERDGNALMYSTYFGGSGNDGVGGIATDQYGNVYLAGFTTSDDYPLQNAFQTKRLGPQDAVLTKLSRDGMTLLLSTYLGGSAEDAGTDVAVDDQGDIYVIGNTNSTDFPIQHALRSGWSGGQDAWLLKMDRSGSKLRYSTYLGGSGDDYAASLALDQAGHAHITGSTSSQDFPVYAALQPTNAGPWFQPLDLFLCKLTSAGDAFVFSTYLGGSDYDFLGDIAVDYQNNIYLAAATFSLDFPQVKPLRPRSRHQDLVLAKFPPHGDSLIFSTFLGGVGNDWATSVAVNADGEVFLTGDTRSPDFPVVRPLQRFNASGNFDAIVVRIEDIDYVCGDADGNGVASIFDAVFISNYIFNGGREPEPLLAGDVDCNLLVNISDAVYLISFVFGGWPQPCAECQ